MKLSKSTIAATFAAVLIGGLSIGPASAAFRNNEHTLTEFTGDGGSKLNGSITVYDDGDSLVNASEIIEWSYTSDLKVLLLFNSRDRSSTLTSTGDDGGFAIGGDSLDFDFRMGATALPRTVILACSAAYGRTGQCD